jgi:hypothetical protein
MAFTTSLNGAGSIWKTHDNAKQVLGESAHAQTKWRAFEKWTMHYNSRATICTRRTS